MNPPKNPEIYGPPPGEKKEISFSPFERATRKVSERILSEYLETARIDESTIKFIQSQLEKDLEETYCQFALKWAENNQQEILTRGFPIGQLSPEAIINLVLTPQEKGGMGISLETQEGGDYREYKEKFERIVMLQELFRVEEKERPYEAPFLLFFYFQERKAEIEEEVKKLSEQLSEKGEDVVIQDTIEQKKNLVEEITKVQKEIFKRITGRNLDEEVRKEIESQEGFISKEEYVLKNIEQKKDTIIEEKKEEIIKKEWENYEKMSLGEKGRLHDALRKILGTSIVITDSEDLIRYLLDASRKLGINENAFYKFIEQGYKPWATVKRWFGRVDIPDEKGNLMKFSSQFFEEETQTEGNRFQREVEEEARRRLEKEWEDFYGKSGERYKGIVERRLKEFGEEGNFIKLMEDSYNRARRVIIDKWFESIALSVQKSKEEQQEIERRFGRGKENFVKFLKELYDLKLEGSPQEKKNSFKDFLGKNGFDETEVEEILNEVQPQEWVIVEKKKGLLELFFKILEKLIKRKGKTPGKKDGGTSGVGAKV